MRGSVPSYRDNTHRMQSGPKLANGSMSCASEPHPFTLHLNRKIFKKSLTMPKKTKKGNPFVSPGVLWYAGKKGKTFVFQFLVPKCTIWHLKVS